MGCGRGSHELNVEILLQEIELALIPLTQLEYGLEPNTPANRKQHHAHNQLAVGSIPRAGVFRMR